MIQYLLWHLVPSKLPLHLHANPCVLIVHIPLFRQGLDLQGSNAVT